MTHTKHNRRQSKRHHPKRHHRGGSGPKPLSPGMVGGSGLKPLGVGEFSQSGGGNVAQFAGQYDPTPSPSLANTMKGGYHKASVRRSRSGSSAMRGGSMLQSALAPLSLLGLQQWFGKSRKTRQKVSQFSRKMRKSVKRVF